MFPRDLILVRHGQSEQNAANDRSRAGDHSDFTDEFVNRYSGHSRLTRKGRQQLQVTGEWLKRNGFADFDQYYVSEYARALESASCLNLENASWEVRFDLRERDHGHWDVITENRKHELYAEEIRLSKMHWFYTHLPGGESMAQVCDRLRLNIIERLHQETKDGNSRAIIVSHGDVMRAFRTLFEGLTAQHFHDNPEYYKVGNGHVLHYTRADPNQPEVMKPEFGWVRSVNPPDVTYSGHDWQPIERKCFSNEELLALANQSVRLIDE